MLKFIDFKKKNIRRKRNNLYYAPKVRSKKLKKINEYAKSNRKYQKKKTFENTKIIQTNYFRCRIMKNNPLVFLQFF